MAFPLKAAEQQQVAEQMSPGYVKIVPTLSTAMQLWKSAQTVQISRQKMEHLTGAPKQIMNPIAVHGPANAMQIFTGTADSASHVTKIITLHNNSN